MTHQWGDDDQVGDGRCDRCNHKGHRHEVRDEGGLGRCLGFGDLGCDCEQFEARA